MKQSVYDCPAYNYKFQNLRSTYNLESQTSSSESRGNYFSTNNKIIAGTLVFGAILYFVSLKRG